MLHVLRKRIHMWLTRTKGQAVTEYSILMAIIVIGIMFGSYKVFPAFIRAFQLYFDSYYFMLNLPFP